VESEHLPRDRPDSLCAGQSGALPPVCIRVRGVMCDKSNGHHVYLGVCK
jgi:hypothetical protein